MAIRRSSRRDRPEPPGRLLSFEATDGVRLSGLLFEPQRQSQRAIVFLHGTGGASIFEQRRTNILADAFTRAGIAYFPFDNRGSQIVRRLRKKLRSLPGGSAHERIRDAVYDIDGAARLLRKRGYRELILAGHSTGANKVAAYDHYRRRNPFKRYVLLAGGDDTGLLQLQLRSRYRAALARAKERRNSYDLVPASLSSQPMSWRAFYDMANPRGDYNVFDFATRRFRFLRTLRKPSLLVYGEHDEFLPPHGVAILADAIGPKPNIELATLEDADHGFSGHERELAELILNWLADDRR